MVPCGQAGAAQPRRTGRQGGSAPRRDPRQVALAWPLQRSPGIPPIPGTTSVAHLEENVAAASLISAAAADGRDDRRRKLFRARCARPEPQADRPSDSPRDPAGTLTSSAGWCGG
ncbi:aldo/keto reductase [Streptomyces antimycoticus]|uniref:aldo/keto reductase n=1 Tax=Streptomyces antimycoticus TaxID=68175 RepID=UPI0036A62391